MRVVGRGPVQRDLAVDAGLGLQVRVADEGRGALAAESGDTVVQVGGLGRLEAGADAALQRPCCADVPHGIGAWTELAAEHAVIVVAQAQCDGQCIQWIPVVLREQRPHPVLLDGAAAIAAAFHAEHAVFQFAVDHLAADDEAVRLADGEIQFGVQRVLAAFHRALRTREEGIHGQLLALRTRHSGIGAGSAGNGVVAVDVLVQQPLGNGERQRAAVVAGVDVRKRDEAVAERPLTVVGHRPLVAGEFLIGRVSHPWRRAPDAVQSVHGAQRIRLGAQVVDVRRVVVHLPGRVVVEDDALAVRRRPAQRDARALVGVVHGLAAATEAQCPLEHRTVRRGDRLVFGRRRVPLVPRTAHAQAQTFLHQRPHQHEVEGAVAAEIAVLLDAVAERGRALPAVRHLARDDVDHPAQRVGAVQGGRRPADHFDALDHVQRRNMVELVAAERVGVDVAVVVLALAVDQDQRVVRPHATDADGLLSRLVGGLADIDALQIAHGVDQGDVGALAQFLRGDHADAGGCVGDLLFETGGRDDNGVEGADIGGVGRGLRDGGGSGDGQQGEGKAVATQRGAHGRTDDVHGIREEVGSRGAVARVRDQQKAASGIGRAASGSGDRRCLAVMQAQ